MFKRLRREEGQSYLETALVLPILVLLVMGVLDIGRAFNAYVVVMNAAREGARYGIAHASNPGGVKTRVLQEIADTGITVDQADITVAYPNGQAPGKPIQVTVTHNFQVIAALVLGLDSIPVTATAEMEIIQ